MSADFKNNNVIENKIHAYYIKAYNIYEHFYFLNICMHHK